MRPRDRRRLHHRRHADRAALRHLLPRARRALGAPAGAARPRRRRRGAGRATAATASPPAAAAPRRGLAGTPRHSPATSRRPARPRLSACNWRGSVPPRVRAPLQRLPPGGASAARPRTHPRPLLPLARLRLVARFGDRGRRILHRRLRRRLGRARRRARPLRLPRHQVQPRLLLGGCDGDGDAAVRRRPRLRRRDCVHAARDGTPPIPHPPSALRGRV